jgi:hypothetical protein
MTWSPAKFHIQGVTLNKPTHPGAAVNFTLTGGGFSAPVEVFLVHHDATAMQLVTAFMNDNKGSGASGVIRGDAPSNNGTTIVTCHANLENAKAGAYDVIVTQIVGGALEVAKKTGAFDWP